MLKAALVDLDGFLINSEELYLEANKIYFKRHNFEFTEEHHRQGTGKRFPEWIKTVVNIDKTGEEIFRERNIIFNELVKKKLKLLPGAKSLLEALNESFKTALVTSSRKDYVDLVFKITGIKDYFDLVITGEIVKKGKPDPESFLSAANKLGVKPRECVVFEDSPTGVLAGKNAGMKVVAVPSQFVKDDKIFNKADLVLRNLKQISIKEIKLL
ncbi:MAG: hypothetical protein A2Z11_01080 [Candidatus Woykebacteria bacterium RBG_16_43_9]|uniref:FCP1 homology domain-containing protein n=1 Tax=Candidatus Woykebacteria bacterium RBG_16_43_9 TaxID=1802596 RepID=A0A1G1WDJ1_9BACT|nr:MAG: hypothetical protein A2Z11_01080 [Candidatus Woykebacteria bacterium RBG_16_43_9]